MYIIYFNLFIIININKVLISTTFSNLLEDEKKEYIFDKVINQSYHFSYKDVDTITFNLNVENEINNIYLIHSDIQY